MAAIATLALAPQSAAEDPPLSPNGDTVGSHPDASTSGTEGDTYFYDRAVFFVEGPATLVFSPLVRYVGTGEVFGVEALLDGNIRLEFSPELTVMVDMSLFDDPRVSAGFRAATTGAVSRVRWDLGTHRSATETLATGAQVVLPVTRLRRSGMLDQGLGFDTYHAGTGRTSYSVGMDGDSLVIRSR